MADKPKVLPPFKPGQFDRKPKGHSGYAPDPGYDKTKAVITPLVMIQPTYPADFKAAGTAERMRGKPGNVNAQAQAAKSKKYE